MAEHHGPGITRSLVRAQVLPDTPVTPPAAAHAGLAPAGAQLWGRRRHGTAPGLGFRARDSLRRRAELSDSHAVVEGQRRRGDQNGAEPELHAHRDVVCRRGERARAEEWGGALGPPPRSSGHTVRSAPRMGKGHPGLREHTPRGTKWGL